MFGYILALVIGVILLGLWLAASTHAAPEGQHDAGDKPVQRDRPSADEPTPDRSATAPSRTVRAARRRTPPA